MAIETFVYLGVKTSWRPSLLGMWGLGTGEQAGWSGECNECVTDVAGAVCSSGAGGTLLVLGCEGERAVC